MKRLGRCIETSEEVELWQKGMGDRGVLFWTEGEELVDDIGCIIAAIKHIFYLVFWPIKSSACFCFNAGFLFHFCLIFNIKPTRSSL
jgi:hypothetical protein